MASSQVEIATSSPFGCGTTARRDSCFQNSHSHQIDLTDLWVHQPQWEAPTSTTADANCNDSSNYRPTIDYRPNNLKDKWARAREIVFPGERKQPVEVSNSGGVSSLVQKWRGFEAEAKVATNKSSSNAQDGGEGGATNDDESIGDWESDRTVVSGRSSCRERDSDFTESERLRVADIIRRLTEEGSSYSPPRVRTSWDHQSEPPQRSPLSPVIGSPRIRGRQAYIDILTQMERDRRNELERLVGRKAVSQFSHRGRIQALLRIKFLRRGLGAIEGRFSNTTASKPPPTTHLRESHDNSIRPEKATDKAAATPNEEDAENQMKEEDECHQVSKEEHTSPEANTISAHQSDEVLHSYPNKASPFSKFIRQDSSNIDHSLAKYAEAETESEQNNKEDQSIDHQVTEPNYDTASDFANPQSYHEEEEEEEEEEESNDNQQAVESDAYWVSDASHAEAGWEEVQSDYQEEGVSKGDWIGEVSRPRSDWEDLRQARYQEMLDPFLDNEEIRALLGRKSVSGFLSSGMREKIDQVMMFRCQTVKSNLGREEKREERLPEQGNAEAVAVSEEGEGEEVTREGYADYFDEFEEAESSLGGQQSDYMDQTPAWPQNQGHESSVYSYQVESTPPQQSPSIGPTSSYGAHPAIEMEVIYELRRHMEQLHQEMSELRKSIKCCTDMQVKLQRSIKKEVTTALTQPDHTANGRRNPTKKGASGGRCCVCRKVQVDCVLYRCGHMCTCFKCAHELQWSSGKCPVCRARIVDVVRTYSNY